MIPRAEELLRQMLGPDVADRLVASADAMQA